MYKIFYSKSKDNDDINCGYKDWRKRLSNFWESEIEYYGKKYKSTENLYQSMKFNKFKKYQQKFELNRQFGEVKSAKKNGGKTACKNNNVTIDDNWDMKKVNK